MNRIDLERLEWWSMGMIGVDVRGVEVDSIFQAEESSQLKSPGSKMRECVKREELVWEEKTGTRVCACVCP